MRRHDQSALFLTKAAQDEYVLAALVTDPSAPIEVFGFHAQQAAEKLLKAVLVSHGIEYPPTHQLVRLIDLVTSNGITFPRSLEEIRLLSPFAVEFRYDVIPNEDEEDIDKSAIRGRIADLRIWAEKAIKTPA